MNIWVDADACPVVIKEIIYRAAIRTQTTTTLVANQPLRIPPSVYLKTLTVSAGFDVADNEIVKLCQVGDLVITADIPLAAEIVALQGQALNPRGELYTEHNIKARLNMRDFMDNLRGSGIHTGGPAGISQQDRQAFANNLDTILRKNIL